MGEGQDKTIAYITTRAMICVVALLMLVAANPGFHSGVARAATRTRVARGTLSSAPVAGPTRATIVVSGSGWQGAADGTVINFGFSTDPSCAAAFYTPATTEQAGIVSRGAFSGWFLWPATTPVGMYAVCVSVGTILAVAGSYTVLSAAPPQLTISSPTLNVGQQAMVRGRNFLPPQTNITLTLQQLSGGTSITVGTVTSDANGAFSQAFTTPANPTGPVVLTASAGSGTPPTLSASVTFIVYAAPQAPTPTPTPTTTPSPSPTPVPGRTPTPQPTAMPTTAPPQQATALPAPTPTPISLGAQPQAPTPTSSSTPTGQTVVQKPAASNEQSDGKKTTALIAGALSILLVAALVVLLWRHKVRKGAAHGNAPAYPLYPAFADAGSFNWTQSTEGPDWDSLPDIGQQVSPSLPEPAANINGNLNMGFAPAARMYETGEMPETPALYEVPGSEVAMATTGILPTATPESQSDDLLQDPLLAAIMQQARCGLFVLPGKKP